ncbi:PhnA domain-containing protein [Arcobacter sp. FWKO B]|uniref:PhnA domain-containing protein n=1 Tax=Arcobacter sp. FWKO B TaxID=2593672 RepID=UPI0018A4A6AE|nr:alkylphosphonate utilization protein [Arcobacter sp. FWKO B]QOG12555.1 PhnA domain protein [Arcobacter sp. FWKO B]
MSIEKDLEKRSNGVCELCGSNEDLKAYQVNLNDDGLDGSVLLCGVCNSNVDSPKEIDMNHWRCLSDSMWNENQIVQILAYRTLKQLNDPWANELLDMMYLDDEAKAIAEAGIVSEDDSEVKKDANGNILVEGDSVTIIKDLEVKGAGFTAKRGTVVKGIGLGDVAGHIEGKVNGTKIYLKTCFLKKV